MEQYSPAHPHDRDDPIRFSAVVRFIFSSPIDVAQILAVNPAAPAFYLDGASWFGRTIVVGTRPSYPMST